MEFPSKDIWSIVFVTGDAARSRSPKKSGADLDQRLRADRHVAAFGFRVLRAAQATWCRSA